MFSSAIPNVPVHPATGHDRIHGWVKRAAIGVGVVGLLGAGANGTTASAAPSHSAHTAKPKPPARIGAPKASGVLPASPFDAGTVATRALSPASASYAADVVADYHADYGAVGVNQLPIYTIPANQPRVRVSVISGCNDFTPSTGTSIPIPAYAVSNGSSDSPMVVNQPSTHTEWELWQAHQVAGGWSACWGGKLDTTNSSGTFAYPYGLSATGISYLATTITESDIASGSINHTLSIQLPRCNAPAVSPANRTDCGSDPSQPAEGQTFRLPAAAAMPAGLTPFGQMVFRALQTHGAVVTDRAGAVMIQAEQVSDWGRSGHAGVDPITASWQGRAEYQVVANLPWAQLQTVQSPR